MKTTIDWFDYQLTQNSETHLIKNNGVPYLMIPTEVYIDLYKKSKAYEKNNTDNKIIHFAEWLTNKHTSTLITLYEHFEEQFYNDNTKSEL